MTQINLNVKTSILPNEMMYFVACINYTIIYYKNRTEIICVPLKKIEEKLQSYPFCRIHKSYLVNVNYMSDRKTRYLIEMTDNSILTISRRKTSAFKKFLKKNASVKALTKKRVINADYPAPESK
ncbi:LytR/AlgR family response regulator transcription factor [Emticicia fluvialis]|uniref:LytR/AlgR family response regulator transcription factor n=1 Tax=Emticicia fluvialis TaxID=2974474 RepID=UPI002164F636|nr:LytTR family DNA-binding domain-containing protein [Emticicia fluvialis]